MVSRRHRLHGCSISEVSLVLSDRANQFRATSAPHSGLYRTLREFAATVRVSRHRAASPPHGAALPAMPGSRSATGDMRAAPADCLRDPHGSLPIATATGAHARVPLR